MKTGHILYIVAALMVAASNAQVLVEDLQGEYMGQVSFPTIMVLTEDGNFTNVCRDEFSRECLEELGLPVERVVINGSTIEFNFVSASNASTREEISEAYPTCVAEGKYPVRNLQPLPPGEIQSYDYTTGHLTFIDPRRPNDTNCAIITVKETPEGKSLSAKYILMADSMPGLDVVIFGPSFRCIVYNGLCISITSPEGEFTAFVNLDFDVPCVAGKCMES